MKLEILIPDHEKDEVHVTFSTELQEGVDVIMTKKELLDYINGKVI